MTVLTILGCFIVMGIFAVLGLMYTVTINALVFMTRVTQKFWNNVETTKAIGKAKWKTFKSEHNF